MGMWFIHQKVSILLILWICQSCITKASSSSSSSKLAPDNGMFFIDDPPGSDVIEGSAEDNFSGKGDDDEDSLFEGSGSNFTDETYDGSGAIVVVPSKLPSIEFAATSTSRSTFAPFTTTAPRVTATTRKTTTTTRTPSTTTTTTTTTPSVLTVPPKVVHYIPSPTHGSNDLPELEPSSTRDPMAEYDDNELSNEVLNSPGRVHSSRPASFFGQPGMLAAVIGGAVVGLLCAILLVMFIVYRMRKKDEGSYPLDQTKRSPPTSYSRSSKEFYA